MIFADYVACHEEDELVSVTAAQAATGIVNASPADRKELLSLLRARICLNCGDPRTGTFTSCPMCRSTYPKDP